MDKVNGQVYRLNISPSPQPRNSETGHLPTSSTSLQKTHEQNPQNSSGVFRGGKPGQPRAPPKRRCGIRPGRRDTGKRFSTICSRNVKIVYQMKFYSIGCHSLPIFRQFRPLLNHFIFSHAFTSFPFFVLSFIVNLMDVQGLTTSISIVRTTNSEVDLSLPPWDQNSRPSKNLDSP